MANPMLNSGPMLARGLAQSRASEPTYAALRTALAAGTYQAGQMVWVEDAGKIGKVYPIGSYADDGVATVTGGSLAWRAETVSDEALIANEVAGYAYGSTVYVDSVSGSNSNTGFSFDSPLASLVAANNLIQDGISRLAIRRGSSFRTPLQITSGFQTAEKPFGVVSYGQGARPIVSGGVVQSGPWALESGTEYSTPANSVSVAVAINQPAYYVTGSGIVVRLNRGSAGSLNVNEWDVSGGNVYVNVGSEITGTIEVPAYVPFVISASHVYLNGVEARFSGNDGASITSAPDNIVFRNFRANWNANDGINLSTGGTNVRVVGCELFDNGRESDGNGDGFSAHQAGTGVIYGCLIERNCKDGVSNSSQGTWKITGNRIINNSQGIVVYPEAGTAGQHDIVRNIIRGALQNEVNPAAVKYHMILDAGAAGATINAINNTLVRGENVSSLTRGVRIPGGTVVFKNNTISGAFHIGIVVAGTPTLTEENNNVHGASIPVSGLTLDASSIQSDPLFEDDANGDYRLSSGSDLIDAGQSVSGVTLRVLGSAPDIGAVESA